MDCPLTVHATIGCLSCPLTVIDVTSGEGPFQSVFVSFSRRLSTIQENNQHNSFVDIDFRVCL